MQTSLQAKLTHQFSTATYVNCSVLVRVSDVSHCVPVLLQRALPALILRSQLHNLCLQPAPLATALCRLLPAAQLTYLARNTSFLGLHPRDKNKQRRMAHADDLVPTTMEAATENIHCDVTHVSDNWASCCLSHIFYTSVQHVCMMTYSLRNYVFLLAKYLYTFYITFPRGCWCVCQCFCRRRSTLQVWRWLLYWRTLGQHIAGNWQVVDICAASLPHVLHSRTWWRPDEPMAVGGSPATWSSKHMHEDVGHYHCYFDKLTLVRYHWTFSTEIGWNGNSSTWFSHLAVQFQLR